MRRLKDIAGEFLDRVAGRSGEGAPDIAPGEITIGITTFEHRFDRYFVPLVDRIRQHAGNEIIVAVNGEHERAFGEEYRRRLLECLARHPNVYPVVFPRFRGLSKLWNSVIVHATGDHVLMLNDDIMVEGAGFMDDVCAALRRNGGRTFLINRSWSHFLVSRKEIDELGYFDERLLGIGEEDGDMTWRYIERYGIPVPSVKIRAFVNFAEETVRTFAPANIRTHSGTKYSLFNRRFMFEEKYAASPDGIKGMFDEPVVLKERGAGQYPNERFYRLRKKDL